MAIASWVIALSSQPDRDLTVESVVTVILGLGLAVGAVLLIPISRIWVRWIVNPLILVVPILVTLELFAA